MTLVFRKFVNEKTIELPSQNLYMPKTIMYISGMIVLCVYQLTVVTSFDDIGYFKV